MNEPDGRVIAPGHRAVVSDLVVSETHFSLRNHCGISGGLDQESQAPLRGWGGIRPLDSVAKVPGRRGIDLRKAGFLECSIHSAYPVEAAEMVTFDKAVGKRRPVQVL